VLGFAESATSATHPSRQKWPASAGVGKSMLAARLPGIPPPLEPAEAFGIM